MERRPVFIVKKRDPFRPYFEFRLEVNGVFKSWGLPVDPRRLEIGQRCTAVPIGDRSVQQTLATDHYIWDTGEFLNLDDDRSLSSAVSGGVVRVVLLGRKLRGAFVLTQNRLASRGGRRMWTLKRLAAARGERVSETPKAA